jgi:hypothetical protein
MRQSTRRAAVNDGRTALGDGLTRCLNARVPLCVIASWGTLGGGGCGPKTTDIVIAKTGSGADAGSPGATDPMAYDDRDWATVLRENVGDGWVDYGHLAAHREALDRYLARVHVCGPHSTPGAFSSREDRVCYYVNAFNAGVLAAILQAGVPDEVSSVSDGWLQDRFRMRLDGQWMRLREVESRAVAESADDGRVLFVLCDGSAGSPRPHGQPLRPEGLDETLRLLARKAMDDHRIVAVDHARQELLVATWLMARESWLTGSYERRTGARDATMLNVLLEFAGSTRRDWLNTAVGYPVRMIPFDRRLNRKPADNAGN